MQCFGRSGFSREGVFQDKPIANEFAPTRESKGSDTIDQTTARRVTPVGLTRPTGWGGDFGGQVRGQN